ncbi:MAG: ATP-binding cassette protein [Hydrocarboniphaga sp.]|uniref:ATP-binding cassette domain-containing protein n=1 Tax=Hydrocarboniphaga sp. TaxID=2033016 RepID=UPI002616DDDA|nr:ATP-binding cassette domain-containing protein [Hydrocarboniphaga sp.]MDB5969617.1 ATP-binding cassette protein [Hydrocarboniphaga sp.]
MLDVDLSFRRGSFDLEIAHGFGEGVTGICGPSGSGKSTLLALAAGLLSPARGSIRFDRQTLVDCAQREFVPAYRRRFGLVFQDGQLFPHLTVSANLLYGWRGLAHGQRRFTLEGVTALLEIGALLERRPDQLSGGERQRVALGRALLYSPRLLLLDEPLSSLDTRLKAQILPFLKRVRDETKLPMLYVSHSPQEVAYLADQVLQIENGRLVP